MLWQLPCVWENIKKSKSYPNFGHDLLFFIDLEGHKVVIFLLLFSRDRVGCNRRKHLHLGRCQCKM